MWLEQEPGSAGINTADNYRRKVLLGYNFHAQRWTGPKEEYVRPVAAQAEARNVKLVRGEWNEAFLQEVEVLQNGRHDDLIDATSKAFTKLTGGNRVVQRKLLGL